MTAPLPLPGRARNRVALVAVGIVAFAFWRALFAGGSLVSADIVATAPPVAAGQEVGYTPENGPGDPINIHSHWASLASDVRSGDVAWWDPDLAGGQPTFKGGLPPFDLLYLLVPAWFAPGLVAAVRALTAIGLTGGWLRLMGTGRVPALVGGLAYGFSGFMVGWMNWPHSSVAALAPGLLWAVEAAIRDPRVWRAAPIGLVTAAMIWSNFPQVTYYLLIAVAVYAVVRVASEPGLVGRGEPLAVSGSGHGPAPPASDRARNRRALALVVAAAVVLALGAAAPHLVGFAEYLDWADTGPRGDNPVESAAGAKYLLTAFTPVAFGSDAVGPAYFGEGNWPEFQIYTGLSVVLLAVSGAAGVRTGDRRRRAATWALLGIAALGVVIAYVGGPLSVAVQEVAGDQIGLATRAKVMISLAVALLAGLGADRWSRPWDDQDRRDTRRITIFGAVVLGLIALALVPSLLDWRDMARQAGTSRAVVAWSSVPALAGVALVAVLGARWRGWLTATGTGWLIVGVVSFELLSFAMPVPTTVDREDRLAATDAHRQVADLLDPGERLAGEGRTFFPNTTELFGIDDARGQVFKSAGYQALLRAVDPQMLEPAGGGTATYPNVAVDTDPSSPVWDAMAVGVWAQFNSTVPPGDQVRPAAAAAIVDSTAGPLTGTVVVPPGGLRAVMFEVFVRGVPAGRIRVTVDVDGDVRRSQVDTAMIRTGFAAAAIVGEDLPAGAVGRVTFEAEGSADQTMVAVEADGELSLGTVAGGDDGLRLVRAGDLTLLERTTTEFARLHDTAVVIPDPMDAAHYIAASIGPRAAVVDRDVGLPETSSVGPDASIGEVESLDLDSGTIRVRTSTDRSALLVVAENWYPGWSARVDGESAEVVTADGSFMGVVVPSGSHTVTLGFEPRHLGATTAAAALALLASVGLLLQARRFGLPSSDPSGR